MKCLSLTNLPEAVAQVCRKDPDLAAVVARFGVPPLWDRPPGFASLMLIILEQQVSLSSARAAFHKLLKAAGNDLTPEKFLGFTDRKLKEIGFSRQKTAYGRGLAQAVWHQDFDLKRLETLDDGAVRKKLLQLKGIGPWTADIYLVMALLRPDVWPQGDLALAKAVQEVKNLSYRPDNKTLAKMADQWKPYRSVAARIVWFHYLKGKG